MAQALEGPEWKAYRTIAHEKARDARHEICKLQLARLRALFISTEAQIAVAATQQDPLNEQEVMAYLLMGADGVAVAPKSYGKVRTPFAPSNPPSLTLRRLCVVLMLRIVAGQPRERHARRWQAAPSQSANRGGRSRKGDQALGNRSAGSAP